MTDSVKEKVGVSRAVALAFEKAMIAYKNGEYGLEVAAFLAALRSQGLVILSREPTEKMVVCGGNYVMNLGAYVSPDERAINCYRAMIAASEEDGE